MGVAWKMHYLEEKMIGWSSFMSHLVYKDLMGKYVFGKYCQSLKKDLLLNPGMTGTQHFTASWERSTLSQRRTQKSFKYKKTQYTYLLSPYQKYYDFWRENIYEVSHLLSINSLTWHYKVFSPYTHMISQEEQMTVSRSTLTRLITFPSYFIYIFYQHVIFGPRI